MDVPDTLAVKTLVVSKGSGDKNLTLSPGDIVLAVAPPQMAPEVLVFSKPQTSGSPLPVDYQIMCNRQMVLPLPCTTCRERKQPRPATKQRNSTVTTKAQYARITGDPGSFCPSGEPPKVFPLGQAEREAGE